jgi:aminoglycoside phosphotransferase (APT) family kinase protein
VAGVNGELAAPLARWLAAATGAEDVAVRRMARLGGGAIQENWSLDVACRGGRLDGEHALVLRTDAASRVPVSWDRAQEYRILEAAFRAGVAAPEPIALCEDTGVIGKVFYVMRRAGGEARGHKLVRDPAVRARGEALAGRLGAELAKLHRLAPPVPGLGFIPVPDRPPALWRVAEYRRHLDELRAAELVLEWALAWLERHAPEGERLCLVHSDFRTGNFLVEDGGLTAVLDWEFAGFSDPLEDLGWMLAKCWRFGAYELEAGGIGSREAFLAGYEAEAGRPVDRAAVPYWEVMATVRWAVIALMQAARHYRGHESSLELALTAHVLPVLELDLLTRVREIEETGR